MGFSRIGPNGENSDFPLNVWHHIAGVKKGNNLTVYINGVVKGNVGVPANHAQGVEKLYVGKSPSYRAATFIIDDLGIYNRALDEKEVKKDMEGGVLPRDVDIKDKLTTTWANIKQKD
jgi:hypothetical protein